MKSYIIKEFLKHGIIREIEIEEYMYSLTIIELKLLHYITVLSIGLLFSKFTEFLCFISTYSIIRKYLGGFHAQKSVICFSLSIFFSLIFNLILETANLKTIILFIMIVVISLITLLIYKKKNNKLIVDLVLLNILSLFIFINNCNSLLLSIVSGVGLSMLLKILDLNLRLLRNKVTKKLI